MSRSILGADLNRYYVESPTQIIGDLERLYFNPKQWKVTFLGVSSGHHFIKKHLLISTGSVKNIDMSSRRIFIKEDTHPNFMVMLDESELPGAEGNVNEIIGFDLIEEGVYLGKVTDISIDREKWNIEAFEVTVHSLLHKRKILIPAKRVYFLSFQERKIFLKSEFETQKIA